MPVFNIGFTANISSSQVLKQVGSLFPGEIAVPDKVVKIMEKQNLPITSAIKGYFLIDTGASISGIKKDIVQTLHLPVIGSTYLNTPSDTKKATSIVPAKFILLNPQNQPIYVINFERVICCERYLGKDIIGIIGRDVLEKSVFIYNGINGNITLAF
ncbi:MAG: aspartyl protease family protein [Candidatus Omnitrophica bacterium]|nr:aspartyl protease family protein [Candidatus Omnitrophota bacterium]